MNQENDITVDMLLAAYDNLSKKMSIHRFRNFANHLRNHELNLNQFSILVNILRNGACSSIQLAHHLKLKAASITYLVDSLEKRKLVKRINNPEDGRSHLINLTDAGREVAYYNSDNKDAAKFFEWLNLDDKELLYVAMRILNRKLPDESEIV
ncbi:MarR family transcriptional regulator [Neobacillus cucumis]|uniref:MarR family winged helix-turn-helix transcriptional regulator n=1 Tax=Neobacillus cucumis TaxID=1740721 RepID=UPI002041E120|nr:MarR family transcriptional regulator [Neobacillus cucumis]MCM3729963.1 MarR family transcriptional regulator [Neobacillus cucumis]